MLAEDGILYFTVVKVDAAVDATTDEGIVIETGPLPAKEGFITVHYLVVVLVVF
jgi:hypothetical protein